MKKHFTYLTRKAWLFSLCLTVLLAGAACHRDDCPAHHGGYIDNPKKVAKQKHKKHKSGLFDKKEKLHGF